MTEAFPSNPERGLILSYVPSDRRAAVSALWALDDRLAASLDTAREPTIRLIRLAWWREALAALDRAQPQQEPLLIRLAEEVVAFGLPGSALADMTDGWERLTEGDGSLPAGLLAYAEARGSILFGLSARLLGGGGPSWLSKAGSAWALSDLAIRQGLPDPMRGQALALFEDWRWPAPLRPLGMRLILARRDMQRGHGRPGSPARMLALLRHRFTGR